MNLDRKNFKDQTFDNFPETVLCSNFRHCTFNAKSHFERCNLIECTFNAECTFDRSNVYNEEDRERDFKEEIEEA